MSKEGLERLKRAEPYRRTAYQDGKNGWSIGHGVNNKHHPEIFKRYGPSVTEEQAHQQVEDVNRQHARDLRQRFGSETWDNLNQGMRDALLISAYNAGPKRVAEKTRDSLRRQDWKGVTKELREMAPFGFVGTERVNLSSRRKADADYFLENSPTED
jgi:GH24 family phage-related lysozyme (muramidase)